MQALTQESIVAVVGAGAMGAGIAQVAAQAGHRVRIYDKREGAAAKAIESIAEQLAARVRKGKSSAAEQAGTLARLSVAHSLQALTDAALVIEAIVEQPAPKRDLFAELERVCPPSTVLASNTSSLSITLLAAGLAHPERVIGVHFFNPAPAMALVEIVSGLATSVAVAQEMAAAVTRWGKTPVHCRSTPGFIVNRVARPFYAESLRLLQEGSADCATLDALLREAGGFRMGAFELTDLIGHDVNYAVTCSVFDAFYGDFRYQPSLVQRELVEAGFLGRKRGRGFYHYHAGAALPVPRQLDAPGWRCTCNVEGDLGPARALVQRLRRAGIEVIEQPGAGVLRVGNTVVALSDGRMAAQRALEQRWPNLALFDLAHDYATVPALGVSFSNAASAQNRDEVAGLFAAAGIVLRPLADLPGLPVLRTVAMLANEAADALLQGVASAADIDLAMCKGVNYPSGPLAWADAVGNAWLLGVLEQLQAAYGEDRYRPSVALRLRAANGEGFHVGGSLPLAVEEARHG